MVLNNRQGENGSMQTEIDLLALLKLLWTRKWIIIAATLVMAGAGFLYARFYLVPTYRTSFTAFVNNRKDTMVDSISSSDLSTSRSLTYTYAEIIKSDPVLEKAADAIGLEGSLVQYRSYVTTRIGDNTQLVYVYVTMTSPSLAAQYANSIATVSQSSMADIVEGSSMKIVVDARVPRARYFPSYSKYTLIAGLIGAVVSSAIILLVDFLDQRVKSEEDLSENYGLSIIGSIPSLKDMIKEGRSGHGYGYGQPPEQKQEQEG